MRITLNLFLQHILLKYCQLIEIVCLNWKICMLDIKRNIDEIIAIYTLEKDIVDIYMLKELQIN